MEDSILVTGGTGTFGRAFVRYLLDNTEIERICIYSRGEHSQAELYSYMSGFQRARCRFFIGDVRDRQRLTRAAHGCRWIVHAAALKRIEVGHYNPQEMVKTNVLGSMNVLEAAQDVHASKVILISSDKAYQPVSAYGQSKALAESLFIAANHQVGDSGPQFSVVRYGNVWKSAGSFIPKWKDMIAKGALSVPVTDPECTRFFMTVEEACALVMKTLYRRGGELVVPDLPAYRIGDVVDAMGVRPNVTGLPRWEKLHESMDDDHCSLTAPRMSVEEIRQWL